LKRKVESVKDPTAWVTSAIRKEGGGAVVVPWGNISIPQVPVSGGGFRDDLDQKLRKRVGWLNNQGGFENRIQYAKVAEAAIGVEESVVFKVLKNLEEKGTTINEPTSWVTAALRKESGGNQGAHVNRANLNVDFGEDLDLKLRKRVGWLNKEGGFDNKLQYNKILDAADGADPTTLFRILKTVEEKLDTLDDPTAWVTHALRKERGGIQRPSKVTMKPMFQKRK